MEPQLIERECGGWMALSPSDSPFNIAVLADDPESARRKLDDRLAVWGRLLEEAGRERDE